MRYLLIVVSAIAVSVFTCGCDFLKDDPPPPFPKHQGFDKDFVAGKKACDEGTAFYQQAKTAEGHQNKWDLCEKAKYKFRDAEFLLGPYVDRPPSGANIRELGMYHSLASAMKLNMIDRLKPNGRMPQPGDKP